MRYGDLARDCAYSEQQQQWPVRRFLMPRWGTWRSTVRAELITAASKRFSSAALDHRCALITAESVYTLPRPPPPSAPSARVPAASARVPAGMVGASGVA